MGVFDFCAIGIQLDQADGEELHHLPSVVLIRHTPLAIRLLIALGVEVNPHHRAQGHVLQQISEIAKRMFFQDIPVIADGKLVVAHARDQLVGRAHKKFTQGQGHALTDQVGVAHQATPQPGHQARATSV